MTLPAAFILFAIILIQMVVAPSVPSSEKIGDVLKPDVQKLLSKKDYVDKIHDIFATASKSTKEAKEKVVQYSKKKLPENLKKLMENIADAPQDIYHQMEPMLQDITQKTKELDNKLQSESLTYRMIGKPAWGLLSGIAYLGMGALGYAMQSLGTLGQIFNNGVKEGVAAYHDGEIPEGQTKEVFDKIENGVDTFKSWGKALDDQAAKKLSKGQTRRMGTMKNDAVESETNPKEAADDGAPSAETTPA